jgi:hypothetical protein
VAGDLDEQTELGTVYVRSLMRVQFRLALVTSAIVVMVAAGLPSDRSSRQIDRSSHGYAAYDADYAPLIEGAVSEHHLRR